MADAYSDKTKTTATRTSILSAQDLYPDRTATPDSTGAYPIKETGAVKRLPEEFSKTTRDVSNLYKWKKGDKVRGTFAKESVGMKGYRRDIESAPDDNKYKPIWLDTTKQISEEFKKWK
jgi:hypothetical protein